MHPTRPLYLQWALKLFPFGHIPARYICILASADPRFQIAEAATEGLQPGKFATGSGRAGGGATANGAAVSSSGGSGSGVGTAAEPLPGGAPAYPPFDAVLQFLQQQAPALDRRPAEGASLALPAKASMQQCCTVCKWIPSCVCGGAWWWRC